jgi:hypothetical protein
VAGCLLAGCGYTTGSLLPKNLKTIYIPPVKNNIDHSASAAQSSYVPLLEVKVRNAIIDRFLFDGNLRIGEERTADLILHTELIDYNRSELRLTDDDDVQEFRINITVSMELYDPAKDLILWTEEAFIGEATYFTTGVKAKSESQALEDALTDLGRRVVERTIENW